VDNLARILTLVPSSTAGAFQPCVRLHRASDAAARDYAARYTLEMTFNYVANGKQATPVSSNQTVVSTTVQEQLDIRWLRVRGTSVSFAPPPDAGSNVTAVVMLVLTDARGNRIETSDAEVSIIRVP